MTLRRVDVLNRGFWTETTLNLDYQALAWHLMTSDIIRSGHVTLLRHQAREAEHGPAPDDPAQLIVMLPSKGQHVPLPGAGPGARVTFDYDTTDKDEKITNERLTLAVQGKGGLARILAFVADVREQHAAHAWRQQLFRLRPLNGVDKAVTWVGTHTHSTKTFDTVVLDEGVRAGLEDDLRSFLAGEAWYRTMGLPYRRGYMFHGPPGRR